MYDYINVYFKEICFVLTYIFGFYHLGTTLRCTVIWTCLAGMDNGGEGKTIISMGLSQGKVNEWDMGHEGRM